MLLLVFYKTTGQLYGSIDKPTGSHLETREGKVEGFCFLRLTKQLMTYTYI